MDPLTEGYNSLSADINKVREPDEEGVIGEPTPELTLDMSDEDLITLKKDWLRTWEPYEKGIKKLQDDNEDYWLGKQFTQDISKRPLTDNLIFESLETFLPIASRPKAEAVVEADNSEAGLSLADKVRKMLMHLVNKLSYNLKMKQSVRYWALYLLGVVKVGWSVKQNDITCAALRPQKLILDPKATIEESEYTGYYIGEHLQDRASDLILRFPEKTTFITEKAKDKMGTTLDYIMWTTDDYVFWTLENEVLAKNKNPHWNYETKQPAPMDAMGNRPQDAQGNPQMLTIPPKNHFKNKKKPYIFLTFFNLGKQPHDDTNLIQQNLPLQDLINKRLVQMDKNADNANGGLAISGDAFTEEQAAKAAKAKRNGGVIWVPTGPVANAVVELNGAQLPQFVYQSLVDYRGELRNIFGIRGSSPQGLSGERTVRGKMFMQQQDQSRIGGGIADTLEVFSGKVLNWFVQLMYVYYDEPHYASVLGKQKAQEYIQLSNADFTVELTVGIKEGSMVPQDPVSQRQEAMELWRQKALDPITFFDRLDFPNPRESAKSLFLWLSDPIQLFPELAQQQKPQAPPPKPPSESIAFKDVPPEAQAQMLAQAGINVQPQQLALHAIKQKVQEHQLQSASAQQNALLKPKQNGTTK